MNLRPSGYEPDELPLLYLAIMAETEGFEPSRDFHPLLVFKTSPFSRTWVSLRKLVLPAGLEPATNRLWADCSNQLSYGSIMVARAGLEPATFRVWAECSNQLSYLAMVDSTGIEPATSCVQGRRSTNWATGPWSRRQDLNLRPLRPKRSALPNWATSRYCYNILLYF